MPSVHYHLPLLIGCGSYDAGLSTPRSAPEASYVRYMSCSAVMVHHYFDLRLVRNFVQSGPENHRPEPLRTEPSLPQRQTAQHFPQITQWAHRIILRRMIRPYLSIIWNRVKKFADRKRVERTFEEVDMTYLKM